MPASTSRLVIFSLIWISIFCALVLSLSVDGKILPVQQKYTEHTKTADSLISQYECARCHQIQDIAPVAVEKSCVTCHQSIQTNKFDGKYPELAVAQWKRNINHLLYVPSLIGIEKRLTREAFASYIQDPYTVRPNLHSYMPRLNLAADDAELITDYFYKDKATTTQLAQSRDISRGKELFATNSCSNCHAFSLNPSTDRTVSSASASAHQRAPNLAFVRKRMSQEMFAGYINSAKLFVPDTQMPEYNFSKQEIADLSAYIFYSMLDPHPIEDTQIKLVEVDRPVTFEEVQAKILRKVCWHCHSDPVPVGGDGGPGNTGGFGYIGKGLDLSSYQALMRGSIAPDGTRYSVLSNSETGLPKIIDHLLARHSELKGVNGATLGMPLGLPAVDIEDISLFLAWIRQGAKPPSSQLPAAQRMLGH